MWVLAATHWRISTGSHYSWIGMLDRHHRLCSLQDVLQHSLSFKKWSEFLYRSETSQPWKSGLLWLENNFRTGGPTQQLRCSLRKIAFSVSPCLDWLRPSFLIVRILRGVAMAPVTGRDLLEFPDPGSAPQQPQPWGGLGREPEKWSSLILLLKWINK